MRWPWVSRKHFERIEYEAASRITTLEVHLEAQRKFVDRLIASDTGHKRDLVGMATAIALRDQEIDGLKATLANMTLHCKALETKQRDLDAPVISAAELDALHKQHAFRIRQVESLTAHNERLEAELDRVKATGHRTEETRPSPVALVQGNGRLP